MIIGNHAHRASAWGNFSAGCGVCALHEAQLDPPPASCDLARFGDHDRHFLGISPAPTCARSAPERNFRSPRAHCAGSDRRCSAGTMGCRRDEDVRGVGRNDGFWDRFVPRTTLSGKETGGTVRRTPQLIRCGIKFEFLPPLYGKQPAHDPSGKLFQS